MPNTALTSSALWPGGRLLARAASGLTGSLTQLAALGKRQNRIEAQQIGAHILQV